jgi:hypothetical protein
MGLNNAFSMHQLFSKRLKAKNFSETTTPQYSVYEQYSYTPTEPPLIV